VNKQYE
jgi:hypothetical protein